MTRRRLINAIPGNLLHSIQFILFPPFPPFQVGFAQRNSNSCESRLQCASRVICAGMQAHYEPLNTCLPPPCEDYYFFQLDEKSQSCKLVSEGVDNSMPGDLVENE